MACLWKAGYAITDPGFSFYHPELRMFDPVSQEGRQLLYAFTEGLSGGCDDSCQVCHIALGFGLVGRIFRFEIDARYATMFAVLMQQDHSKHCHFVTACL